MKDDLEKAGKNVSGTALVDFLCNKLLVATRLAREADSLKEADSILALTCGVGVQAVSKVVDKVVHPAANTVSLGGLQGLWPADERCQGCGQCVLDYTGGICPITFCAKSLLNGPCGGSQDGKCEIDKDTDCAWQLIYDRLKSLDKLENLDRIIEPKDWQQSTSVEQRIIKFKKAML
ncbi:unnamed protein product [marine sediment metagenome]|uniref:Methylene-tetrahydrofolate reductase C-terminal-like domain-containing protein n=1 Tax=marine sediment metagenome TaxID=412755 RepID=X0WMF8_9ZZZZ